MPLTLGTAGHIDHGKSALVQALTGIDPDRLPEEKERGVTIELGFARLVAAADERRRRARPRAVRAPDGRRRERHRRRAARGRRRRGRHAADARALAIIDLLGILRGVVAITKSDLADAEWLALVRADIERLLEGTSIAEAPIVEVSAKTGAGLPELLAELDHVADETTSRQAKLPDASARRPRVHDRGCGHRGDRHDVVGHGEARRRDRDTTRAAFAGACAACRCTARASSERRPVSASR